MAAVFPPDTTQPWVFNNVTYEYDAAEDRWYVVSTTATDEIVESINDLNADIERIDDKIEEEIENRTDLINQAQGKNNAQDAAIAELDARVDSISENIGVLEFKGIFTYTLERSEASCNAAYVACTGQAAGDPDAIAQCDALLAQCQSEVGNPLADGTFTSVGTATLDQVTELIITNTDKNGEILDWLNVVEVGDYLELTEPNTLDGGVTGGDTVLYEVVADTLRAGGQENIRVKFIKETGNGDGHFDLQLDYTIRVFKKDLGIDINEADARYVAKPSKVLFGDNAPTTGGAENGVLRNGELWFDTKALELFVWNNNSWVTASKPASQDIVVNSALNELQNLEGKTASLEVNVSLLMQDRLRSPHVYYSDDVPIGNVEGELIDGDIWIDSNDLTIKFYSQGAWINPDRVSNSDSDNMPIGSIIFWGGSVSNIPTGWLECDGSATSAEVAAATGLSNLPDLKDYMPAGGGGRFGTTVGTTVESKIQSHYHVWAGPKDRDGYPASSSDTSEGTAANQSYWRGNKTGSFDINKGGKHTQNTGDAYTAPPVYLGVYIIKVA